MKRLFILYDADCALCRRIRVWLGNQPAYIPLSFVPLQSDQAQVRFPQLDDLRPAEQLVVISDTGEVWRGESAWITILWALREYREWSQRLAQPLFRPLAARFCAAVSENRHTFSGWMKGANDNDLRIRLTYQALPTDCATQGSCKPL